MAVQKIKSLFVKLFFLVAILANIPSIGRAETNSGPQLIEVNDAHKKNIPCVEYFIKEGKQYCSTSKTISSTKQVIIYPDKAKIAFDNRKWLSAWGKQEPSITTVEYVVIGDNIDNWHELITSQFFPNLQSRLTPKGFAESFINTLKAQNLTPKTTYHVSSPTDVVYEFQIFTPSNVVQDEIQRVFATSKGLHVVHYVIKKADMGEAERQKWIKLLKQATPK